MFRLRSVPKGAKFDVFAGFILACEQASQIFFERRCALRAWWPVLRAVGPALRAGFGEFRRACSQASFIQSTLILRSFVQSNAEFAPNAFAVP